MGMATNLGTGLPSQGIRTPRDRRGGGPVPASASSSSYVGLTAGCSPSPVVNMVIGSVRALYTYADGLVRLRPEYREFVSDLFWTLCFIADRVKCGKGNCICNLDRAWDYVKSDYVLVGEGTLHISRDDLVNTITRAWSIIEKWFLGTVPEKKKVSYTYLNMCVVLLVSDHLLAGDLKERESIKRARKSLRDRGIPYVFRSLECIPRGVEDLLIRSGGNSGVSLDYKDGRNGDEVATSFSVKDSPPGDLSGLSPPEPDRPTGRENLEFWKNRVDALEEENAVQRALKESLARKLMEADIEIRSLRERCRRLESSPVGNLVPPTLGMSAEDSSDGYADSDKSDPLSDPTADMKKEDVPHHSMNSGEDEEMRMTKGVNSLLASVIDSLKRMEDRIVRLEMGGRAALSSTRDEDTTGKRTGKRTDRKKTRIGVPQIPLSPRREDEDLTGLDSLGGRPDLPSSEVEPPTMWSKVVKGDGRKRDKGPRKPPLTPSTSTIKVREKPDVQLCGSSSDEKVRRNPRNPAVEIFSPVGNYAEIMKRAKENIQPMDLGIESLTTRKTRKGGTLLEVHGKDSREKAVVLAHRIREVVRDLPGGVRVSSLLGRSNIRLIGLENPISRREIVDAISREGGCSADDIRVGETRTVGRWGLTTVWAQCPEDVADKLAKSGQLKIGWVPVEVQLLRRREAQCFKCLGRGHFQQWCPSSVDRARCCYRCGMEGHTVGRCGARPHCPLCALSGRPSGHKSGGVMCPPIPPRRDSVCVSEGKCAAPTSPYSALRNEDGIDGVLPTSKDGKKRRKRTGSSLYHPPLKSEKEVSGSQPNQVGPTST
ncbi:uncharacterized protein [Linepithema humile]|uniref:uncharacterized protein n=1 Tax=Linepithema humile TaxID=83485 RepID=UPI00351F57FF